MLGATGAAVTITSQDIVWLCGALGALGGALAAIWKFGLKPLSAMVSRTNQFLDDWLGTPDRPGVPGRPGVMVRLADVEDNKAERDELVALAKLVANKADAAELLALRVALERHITRFEEFRPTDDGDSPHPTE